MYSQAHKRALPEYKGPLVTVWGHPCTGCYTRLYEVLTESVSLLIENYIQAPPNGPTYSGIGKFLEPLSLPIQLTKNNCIIQITVQAIYTAVVATAIVAATTAATLAAQS